MDALSVRLSGKRLYIADLAARLEAMETGRVRMNALVYRLCARRMKTAMAGYPHGMLAAQLGRAHASVLEAIEQREFDAQGALRGERGRRAHAVATALLGHLGARGAKR